MSTIHPTPERASVTRVEAVTVDGERYRVERITGCGGRRTVVERLARHRCRRRHPGVARHSWATSVRWYAAVNPTGGPFQATAQADGSRRGGPRWRGCAWPRPPVVATGRT